MGLPRGRRWVDRPRAPAPNASEMWARMQQLLQAPGEPLADPLALREQMHREVEAARRRQGELPLKR